MMMMPSLYFIIYTLCVRGRGRKTTFFFSSRSLENVDGRSMYQTHAPTLLIFTLLLHIYIYEDEIPIKLCTFSCVFFCTQPLLIFCVCLSLCLSVNISVRSVCHTDVHIYIYIYILYVCMCTKTNEMARKEKEEKKRKTTICTHRLIDPPQPPSQTSSSHRRSSAILNIYYTLFDPLPRASPSHHTRTLHPPSAGGNRDQSHFIHGQRRAARIRACVGVWVCGCVSATVSDVKKIDVPLFEAAVEQQGPCCVAAAAVTQYYTYYNVRIPVRNDPRPAEVTWRDADAVAP